MANFQVNYFQKVLIAFLPFISRTYFSWH